MSTDNLSSPDDPRVEASVEIVPESGDITFEDFTYQEITLGESLLTPGLQTSLVAHAYTHKIKNFDLLKKANIVINLSQPAFEDYGFSADEYSMDVSQTIYRLENRYPLDWNNQEMTFRACDPTLLFDAESLVSKSWKCTTPDEIVSYVLQSCAGAKSVDIEEATPARDYIAENVHPFQVVSQQTNVSLAGGNDPSFLHFMTYENMGTHHFKSLYTMTKQSPIIEFTNAEVGSLIGIRNPFAILAYSFPCDFDLVTDMLNGIDEKGNDISSVILFNPLNKMFSLLGNQKMNCGVGGGNPKLSMTNENTAQNQDSCNDDVKHFLQKRQARMNLVEKDKIALRLTVPFNPILHAGKVVSVKLVNKDDPTLENYGSGDYLILHMTHNIKRGGFAITTMDCVSTTVGQGVV